MMQRDFCRCGNVVYHNGLTNAKCKCGRGLSSGQQATLIIHQTNSGPLVNEKRIIRIVKRFAIESDKGVGDTVERLLARVGGRVFKQKLESLGINCGCQSRQDWLNKEWPYEP